MITIPTYKSTGAQEHWWLVFMNEMWQRASAQSTPCVDQQSWYDWVDHYKITELARYQAHVDDPELFLPDLIFPDKESATAFQLAWG